MAGVLALNFIRRTELPPCTKMSAMHGTPAIANTLLCVRVTAAIYFCSGINQIGCPFFHLVFCFFDHSIIDKSNYAKTDRKLQESKNSHGSNKNSCQQDIVEVL
jgi:hypothetical protein